MDHIQISTFQCFTVPSIKLKGLALCYDCYPSSSSFCNGCIVANG